MSDTHIENAILLAIGIIADKKISQANFDKTIKAVVKERKDKTTGEYIIKYQDSEFTAYATSSDINYLNGTLVYILIPGNDWDRVKTIIGNTKQQATVYKEVPASELLYNRVGTNVIIGTNNISLCSYQQPIERYIYQQTPTVDEPNMVNIDVSNKVKDYIKQGNGLAIGMTVKTSFDSGQIGGWYGLVFNLRFIDSEGNAAVRSYVVSSKDVIGNPYALKELTFVEYLIKDININQFDGILSIVAFADGFPNTNFNITRPDIFITGLYMYGALVLSDELLNGYTVHIDYSETGNIIETDLKPVKLTAQLKVNGKVVTDNVNYYWCKLNGLVFRGNPRYFGRAGEGWLCLNNYFGSTPVPYKTGLIEFYHGSPDATLEEGLPQVYDKVSNIRCVVIYDNNVFYGNCKIIDENAILVSIESSDKTGELLINKTVYYLDNGSPTLTCVFDKEEDKNYKYTWSICSSSGRGEQIILSEDMDEYLSLQELLKAIEEEVNLVDLANRKRYRSRLTDYQRVVNRLNELKLSIVYKVKNLTFYDFPISSIGGSIRIVCTVEEEIDLETTIYIGTGSITLENRHEILGMYSLFMENGVRVFQYDDKGNSPLSSQLEKPLEIDPLSFTLLDNEGTPISYQQIINNGYVKWLFPKENTLLVCNKLANFPLTGEDRYFDSLGFKIYNNLLTFNYSIASKYDKNKTFNYIRLNVKYNDMIFDAYTEFTFPKDGDPGTNGTDFMAKIVPVDGGNVLSTDRLYVSNQLNGQMFDDQGRNVNNIKGLLYNNSILTTIQPSLWTCPPRGEAKDQDIKNTLLNFIPSTKKVAGDITLNLTSLETSPNYWKDFLLEKLPVDIIRAMFSIKYKADTSLEEVMKYYAELPICYDYIFNTDTYRIKIIPKTGFKYVVYSSDGTSPNYDNIQPFEIKVEQYINGYFKDQTEDHGFEWDVIGNLDIIGENNLKQCEIKPKDFFDGSDLSSAVLCYVYKKSNIPIGFIHIPVYMILNRYGHKALNSWDGNSIELNANGDTILAPQVGAGKKDNQNRFTGVLMGDIKEALGTKTGLVGYHQGARSIFLDAETGKALFGKQNAGKIIIDPSLKINGQDAGLIYSGQYPINEFKQTPSVLTIGSNHREDGEGMIIDLSTPQIGFGSGNFTVNSNGEIVARGGGSIAGWKITDNRLYNNNTGMASSGLKASDIKATLPSSDASIAFHAGTDNSKNNFYVTHNGYLFSKSGQIAGWNIDTNKLDKNNVGMNSNPGYYGDKNALKGADGKAKAFFANGDKFYVTHDGYLKSTSGQIASWSITAENLSNKNTGMGKKEIGTSVFNTKAKFDAHLWSGSDSKTINFAVSDKGALYSKSGKIAGWSINDSSLSAAGITISSQGSISAKNWKIYNNSNGSGINIDKGQIGSVTIDSKGISGNGGKWHIYGGTKNGNCDIHLPGLKVTKNGDIYVTNNNAGVSGQGGGGYDSNGNFWAAPSTAKTSPGGPTTLEDQIKEYIVEALGTSKLSLYSKLTPKKGGWDKGHTVMLADKNGAVFEIPVTFTKDITVPASRGTFANGRSGTLTYSNKATLTFSKGILISVYIPKGEGKWEKG